MSMECGLESQQLHLLWLRVSLELDLASALARLECSQWCQGQTRGLLPLSSRPMFSRPHHCW